MGAMPELISSRDASFWGIREKLGRRRWPLLSKKLRNISRSWFTPYFLGSIVMITLLLKIKYNIKYGNKDKEKTRRRHIGAKRRFTVPP